MIKFYLPCNASKFNSEKFKNAFMVGSLGMYKRLILSKVDKRKCDCYDDKILSFISNSDTVNKVNPRKHLCYDIIVYSTRWLKCLRDDSGEYFYILDIPMHNCFGNKHTVDLILRLIEYGNSSNIAPYGLFNRCLAELYDLHIHKMNLM